MAIDNRIYIVKVGSNTLVDDQGSLRREVIRNILSAAIRLLDRGDKIMIVTSGAGKLGRSIMLNRQLSTNVITGVGQMELYKSYQEEALGLNVVLAELLVSRPHILRRTQFLQLQKTVDSFLKNNIIPLINENDALVAGTDWSFGDNDSLASALSIAFRAHKLIILTHVDGLYEDDPEKNQQARLMEEVTDVNKQLLKYCSGNVSSGGRGGMISKLKAIRICTAVGIEAQIVNGLKTDNLRLALENGKVGTVFRSRSVVKNISNRQRWLLAAKNSAGSIEVDEGAARALLSGKSLLAVGIKKVHGQFETDEIIEIMDKNKEGIALGVIDYDDDQIRTMLEKNDLYNKQLMHADNILLIK